MSGGVMMLGIQTTGDTPRITGPEAPRLERDDDPISWHEMSALTPHGVRRRRRLDLRLDRQLIVDAMFRDSHVDQGGRETVIHEYVLHARIDPGTMVVIEADATPRVLPWVECPSAAQSARRLVGMSTAELRARVRAELYGPPTCTHLNDLLRSVEDVVGLAPVLEGLNEGQPSRTRETTVPVTVSPLRRVGRRATRHRQ